MLCSVVKEAVSPDNNINGLAKYADIWLYILFFIENIYILPDISYEKVKNDFKSVILLFKPISIRNSLLSAN